MPINYRFDGNLVWMELLGTYTLEELKQSFAEAKKHPMFPDEASLLIDESKSIALEKRTPAEVQDVSQHLASAFIGHVCRLAILVSSQKQLELSRMADSYANHELMKVRIFLNEKEAVNWLEAGTN